MYWNLATFYILAVYIFVICFPLVIGTQCQETRAVLWRHSVFPLLTKLCFRINYRTRHLRVNIIGLRMVSPPPISKDTSAQFDVTKSFLLWCHLHEKERLRNHIFYLRKRSSEPDICVGLSRAGVSCFPLTVCSLLFPFDGTWRQRFTRPIEEITTRSFLS